jgi:hypothetical protein
MNDKPKRALTTIPKATPALVAAYDKYSRSVAGGFYGDLLKFSGKTGEWTAGPQSTDIAIGTTLVAIIPEMLVGYVRWEDGEKIDEALTPITPDYDAKALRASLGDTDRERWPPGDNGQPEDPWREAAYLPMKSLATGAEYTFSTSSVGGNNAVKRLVKAYVRQIQQAPETTAGHLPVVELGAHSYQHSDRKRGTIYNPVLQGVDWVPASAIAAESHAPRADESAQTTFEDYRSPKEKRAARKRRG